MLSLVIPVLIKIFFFLFFFYIIIFFFRKILKFNSKELKLIQNFYLFVATLCAISFLVFAFYAPYYISSHKFNTLDSFQNIATTISNLMNPFIAIAAAILTFLAFWVQYNANQNIHNENNKQQQERQFYKMLEIHRDNVEKMEFIHLESEEEAQYSPHMINNTLQYPIYEKRFILIHSKGQSAIQYYLNEFTAIYKCIPKTSDNRFLKAYDVFFNGLENSEHPNCAEKALLRKLKEDINLGKKNFIMPYSSTMNGYKIILNPYYRHLYLTVKSIVNSEFEDPEKKRFLDTLRASLTAEEQVLLLFNWYYGKLRNSGYGYKWENKDQKYLTKWKMIHNIVKKDFDFVDEINSFELIRNQLGNNEITLTDLFDEAG